MPERPTRRPRRASTTTASRTTRRAAAPPSDGNSAIDAQARQRQAEQRAMYQMLPRKQQIAYDLRQAILSGELEPGAKVPSETALIDRYDVSRATVRAAVAILRAEGLITTSHGAASRVRNTATTSATLTLDRTPPGEADETSGDPASWPDSEPASHYRIDADQTTADLLGIPAGEPVFVTDRLTNHPEAGQRAATRTYLPFATCAQVPALAEDPFRTTDDIAAALTEAGHEPTWREYVRARMPHPDDTAALHTSEGTPLLVIDRIAHDADGRPLLVEQTRIPGDTTRAAYTLR